MSVKFRGYRQGVAHCDFWDAIELPPLPDLQPCGGRNAGIIILGGRVPPPKLVIFVCVLLSAFGHRRRSDSGSVVWGASYYTVCMSIDAVSIRNPYIKYLTRSGSAC